MNPPGKQMDIETVRSILTNLDQEAYHQAARLKQVNDDVWPPHLEDAFIEAVYVFATVGQKKYQMEETYAGGTNVELIGRNDIISRYIFMKTRQFRARKQVSSHIQVWAHCKKPPSSRDMAPAEFDQFKDMFRRHYSRVASDNSQCRRRIRRVASASAVTLVKRALSRNALGIHSDPPMADRKRDAPWKSQSPAKRCRRVVSELPPQGLRSTSDYGDNDNASDLLPLDLPPLDPATPTHPLFSCALDTCATGTPLAPHLLAPMPLALAQHTPFSAYPDAIAPPFDTATVDSGHAIYELGVATPTDASVAAFTAATFAAMAGLEGTCVTPVLGASDYATDVATLFPQQLKSACATTDAISAFASAVNAIGSECLPQQLLPENIAAPTNNLSMPQPALHPWSQPALSLGAGSARPADLYTGMNADLNATLGADADASSVDLEPVCKPRKPRAADCPLDMSSPKDTLDTACESDARPYTDDTATAPGTFADWVHLLKNTSNTALKREIELPSDCDGASLDWHLVLSQYLESTS
ncbi:hypothetical protein H4S01_004439 [Coemansia sp. RSA 2610]|nr:hypothetical protein IWW54_004337 [Coemansia sp. RSA 2705]KAJ2363154.1 hypothetical protein H4S01_004439 [Coemansia sp. RSA 2610]